MSGACIGCGNELETDHSMYCYDCEAKANHNPMKWRLARLEKRVERCERLYGGLPDKYCHIIDGPCEFSTGTHCASGAGDCVKTPTEPTEREGCGD